MTTGEKIAKLRKENNITQEQLADTLFVSRQAISKWESNITYPETDKLIRMSELFGCSLDYLLKDKMEADREIQEEPHYGFERLFGKSFRERKSEKILWGMPLWHIGKNAKGVIAVGINARGVVAIGLKATGLISIGLLSIGILSFGLLSIGLLAIGLFALGALSAGCFAVGIFAAGAICFGIISTGAIAIGDFSIGALAIGKYAALGDQAQAMIALGDTKATGSLFQKVGELSQQDIQTIKGLMNSNVPSYLSWVKDLFLRFL